MSALAMLSFLAISNVHMTVDATSVSGTISPYIYGANQPDWHGRTKHLTFYRWGGNRTSAYNWETNASNAGTDWYNQNDDYLGGGDTPGLAVRKPVTDAFKAGAAAVVTIPMTGHVAADEDGGGDVNQTPDYIDVRFNNSYPKKNAPFKLQPDLNDHAVYQDEFINQFRTKLQAYSNPLWFCLDNEPDLWPETHPRITATQPTYASIIATSKQYADAIKDVDPGTLVFGPVSYGWEGYVSFQGATDANGRDFLNYYLQRMKAFDDQEGRRLLDVLDLHWYSEATGDNIRITNDSTDPAVYDARVQAPRSLWDPNYTETSWITQWSTLGPIKLIRRMQTKISSFYPGTKLAITEWNYGGGNHITGAIAVADVLGIYGREGVFAAAYWNLLSDESFAWGGFDMFRNFDGAGGHFGDQELTATTSSDDKTSIYASRDSGDPKSLTLVVINKQDAVTPIDIAVTDGTLASVSAYRLRGQGSHPVSVAAPAFTATGWKVSLPAWTVTTYRCRLQ